MGKQVKTPRFYVDIPTFLHATGETQWAHGGHHTGYDGGKNFGGAELLYMNCANPFMRDGNNNGDNYNYMFKIGQNYIAESVSGADAKVAFKVNYIALLNHNLASEEAMPYIRGRFMKEDLDASSDYYREISSIPSTQWGEWTQKLNYNQSTLDDTPLFDPMYNGTSIIAREDGQGTERYYTTFEVFYKTDGTQDYDPDFPHQLGSFSVGRYFDCPNSPDLNLTMSRRFDGIKKQKTIGGKTLANIYYDGPTEWTMNKLNNDYDGPKTPYKYPPFELDDPKKVESRFSNTSSSHFDDRAKSGLGRKGLRSWKLSFSYISEDDMWIDSEVSNRLKTDDSQTTNSSGMLSDDSFNFVWNCTLGGTLPFIFTDDKDSNAPDRYAICNFRENTLSVQQVAFNTYKLSITIDEVA